MTVNWDRNAIQQLTDEVSKNVMDTARRAASGASCPVHHKSARIINRNPRTGEFTIDACCETGKKTATDAVSKALG
jgi:hypothetical protein